MKRPRTIRRMAAFGVCALGLPLLVAAGCDTVRVKFRVFMGEGERRSARIAWAGGGNNGSLIQPWDGREVAWEHTVNHNWNEHGSILLQATQNRPGELRCQVLHNGREYRIEIRTSTGTVDCSHPKPETERNDD